MDKVGAPTEMRHLERNGKITVIPKQYVAPPTECS